VGGVEIGGDNRCVIEIHGEGTQPVLGRPGNFSRRIVLAARQFENWRSI
jgi:hypothetical protein